VDTFIKFCAEYLFIFVVLIFVYAWLKANRKYKVRMCVAIVLAGLVAGIIDKIAGRLYYDPRPFVTHHVTPLVAHASDNGFPSEHTIFTFTIATVLYFYRPKLSYIAFGLAVLVGIGRVGAHIHSPIDIVGGIAIGLISGWTGYQISERYVKRASKKADAKS
jgi:undecaprenyl-diphosphatase